MRLRRPPSPQTDGRESIWDGLKDVQRGVCSNGVTDDGACRGIDDHFLASRWEDNECEKEGSVLKGRRSHCRDARSVGVACISGSGYSVVCLSLLVPSPRGRRR
mmetsp:Transcript_40742/g.101866  ORF Transcript_40742/g.101866 Transcript_40742/m.101866 type:complete len:104 (+) Transcript_40742:2960-3271(+)